jgi:hypothetical protein
MRQRLKVSKILRQNSHWYWRTPVCRRLKAEREQREREQREREQREREQREREQREREQRTSSGCGG